MLVPLVFALAVPASFVHAIEARLAATHLHVVDWWADDLDGDHIPESIAFVCDDDAGLGSSSFSTGTTCSKLRRRSTAATVARRRPRRRPRGGS
ncbi:MAG: hypothetical protein E6J90_33115 [Deltaproteobacteria bacterium]|nr:MAG: hypothetical protein E6J90_33115 [Deltaproteobacteria bacterium]